MKEPWMSFFIAAITGVAMRMDQPGYMIEQAAEIADLALEEFSYRNSNNGKPRPTR